MTLAFRYAARTHVGLVREKNDDSGYAGPHLIAVADGMGGVVGGDIASAITIDAIRGLDRPGHTDPLAALAQAAQDANARIKRRVDAEPRLEGMGTTLTAGVLYDGDKLALLHIGDSFGYLLRDGDLVKITKDHTFVQSLVDDGRLTEAQAKTHPHRALLIKALQGGEDLRPDLKSVALEPGDRLLLTSDGTEDIPLHELTALLDADTDPLDTADAIIRVALRSGTSDNVTCVVADVIELSYEAAGSGNAIVAGAAGAVDLDDNGFADRGLSELPDHTMEQPPVGDIDDDITALGDQLDEEKAEDLRYAPRPPRRFRWLVRSLVAAVVLGGLIFGGVQAYAWTQSQYYLGTAVKAGVEHVAIYRGISQDIPGLHMSSLHEVSTVKLTDLPSDQREKVKETISADSLEHAKRKLAALNGTAAGDTPGSG